MTNGIDAAGLQVWSVEEKTLDTAVCVVRCVGDIVRVGQKFQEVQEFMGPLTLVRILRYQKDVDFVDPPHSAKVHLSGAAVSVLERGTVLTAARTGA
ncbi:hypothetical protein [Streptomyces sp. NPDC001781]